MAYHWQSTIRLHWLLSGAPSFVILFGWLLPGWVAAEHPADQIGYYLVTYGEVPASADPQVARAHKVFTRVRAVADKNSRRLPKKVV